MILASYAGLRMYLVRAQPWPLPFLAMRLGFTMVLQYLTGTRLLTTRSSSDWQVVNTKENRIVARVLAVNYDE